MKKHGFTLIELIITIVIMAGIFAVIPKILFVSGKNDTFAMRQDALMQALSLTTLASHMAWDENNTDHLDILQTQSENSNLECNVTQKFRPGSYIGANGRMCTEEFNASTVLGPESGESDYALFDDIDDFNGEAVKSNITTAQGTTLRIYLLQNSVVYLQDDIMTENGKTLTIDLSNAAPSPVKTTNIKRFKSKVRYAGKRGRERDISAFSYYSTNIGQISLAYRNW